MPRPGPCGKARPPGTTSDLGPCYDAGCMTRRREGALVIMLAVVTTVAMTYPLAFELGRGGRVDSEDGQFSIWNIAWVARTVAADPTQLFHANIFYPHRNTLAFSEANLVAGVLAMPPYWLTRNPYVAHNSVVLLSFMLSLVGVYLLVRHLTGSRPAAAVSAVLFAFCPFVFARSAHIQLLMTAGLPCGMLAFHRLADRPSVLRGVGLGLVLAATGLACGYYGLFAGMMVGVAILISCPRRPALDRSALLDRDRGGRRDRRPGDRRGSSALPGRRRDPRRNRQDPRRCPHVLGGLARVSGLARPLPPMAVGADRGVERGAIPRLLDAWPGRGRARHHPAPGGDGETTPGIPGAHRTGRRRLVALYTLIGLLAWWASLGPASGLYTVLFEIVPGFAMLRAPARLGIVVALCLAVLAGVGVTRLARGRRTGWVTAALILVALAELAALPLSPL